jgi:hypothetical protein
MELQELFSRHGGNGANAHAVERNRCRQQPTEAHLAFIPNQLFGKVLTINATTLTTNDMKTVFIGIITKSYTATMWDRDVQSWIDNFQLLRQHCIYVKMKELDDFLGAIDTARAIVEINTVMVDLSNVPCGQPIRVILLGPGMSKLTLHALTYIMREWKTPENNTRRAEDKKLQVVTSGDSCEHNILKLCQQLCLAGVCQSIEFYNTMQYYPFGHYRKSYFFKD